MPRPILGRWSWGTLGDAVRKPGGGHGCIPRGLHGRLHWGVLGKAWQGLRGNSGHISRGIPLQTSASYGKLRGKSYEARGQGLGCWCLVLVGSGALLETSWGKCLGNSWEILGRLLQNSRWDVNERLGPFLAVFLESLGVLCKVCGAVMPNPWAHCPGNPCEHHASF